MEKWFIRKGKKISVKIGERFSRIGDDLIKKKISKKNDGWCLEKKSINWNDGKPNSNLTINNLLDACLNKRKTSGTRKIKILVLDLAEIGIRI